MIPQGQRGHRMPKGDSQGCLLRPLRRASARMIAVNPSGILGTRVEWTSVYQGSERRTGFQEITTPTIEAQSWAPVTPLCAGWGEQGLRLFPNWDSGVSRGQTGRQC